MKKSFALLCAMNEIYDRTPWSDETVSAYFEALEGVSDERLASFLMHCLREGARIPLPCEVLRVVPRSYAAPAA